MAYTKTNWVNNNEPAINADNLNHLEDGVEKAYGVELLAVVDTAPSECSVGDKYFNTTTNKIYEATATDTWDTEGYDAESGVFYVVFEERAIYTYNGTTLIGVGSSGSGGESIPVGVSVAYMGTTAPQGYLMEDGTLKLISEYPELYDVLGHRYDLPTDTDNTKFRLPNKCGRVGVGLDSTQTEFDTLGETGGSKYLQEHTHTYNETYADGYQYSGGSLSNVANAVKISTTSSAGTGDSGNLQPYIVVNYIIKAHPSAVNTSEVVNEYSTSETNVYSCNYVNIELNKKQKIVNYSTSETDTGKKWIDGKPIYRVVIEKTSDITTGGDAIPFTLTNLNVIRYEGYIINSSNQIEGLYYNTSSDRFRLLIQPSSNQLYYVLGSGLTNISKIRIIVEYTKTTD